MFLTMYKRLVSERVQEALSDTLPFVLLSRNISNFFVDQSSYLVDRAALKYCLSQQ